MSGPQVVSSLAERVKLADGNSIPQLGLGVYEMTDKETYESVKWALQAGYKHIDTAEWYENEAPCGKAINEYLSQPILPPFKESTGASRDAIFLTSKLKTLRSYDRTLKDLRASLKRTGVEYFDMYLLHSAIGGPKAREGCWRACVDAQKEGLVKSIGVSNWGTKHIQELLDAGSPLPAVNQIDLHPFMRHPDIVKICQENGIMLEAWGPLARAMRFDHPTIQKIAKAHGKDQAQIFLRWGIQHGYIVIPKSVSQKRIVSNSEVFNFALSDAEMSELDDLDEHLVTDWDVVDCP